MTAVVPGATAPVSNGPVDLPQASAADRSPWLRRYSQSLVLVDLGALCLAALLAVFVRFGSTPGDLRGYSYYGVAAALVVLWMAVLALSRCYEMRFVGSGPEEFRRVGNASVRLTAVVALIGYGARLDLARGFLAVALPSGLLLLLLGRYLARVVLRGRRLRGEWGHRVVVVGNHPQAEALIGLLRKEPLSGLHVVGACVPGARAWRNPTAALNVPILGSLAGVMDALLSSRADTVAIAASPGITAEALRRLSYELEGTGIDLLVAPALTNITGTRVSLRPVAGLPLLHLDEPELDGARKVIKAVFDRSLGLVGVLLLAPLLLLLAVLIRLDSPGPALFRQERVGRDGRTFGVLKYRTMVVDAEVRREAMLALNEHDGVLFKVRQDPRLTRLGRLLRRFSLDELPQLINVVKGQMSLVGPRPPLPSEVARYEGHAVRRLLVKPGMTGLWQVNGRSDLSWDETVRLDLRYVESWSLGLDLAILVKTVLAVVRGRGAY
ncbi:MAG: polyprenyl glycosylphosphotransferase [Frankiales bacterium]|nr:polyprenyl glycosylphosphotransferase [Frankiales bacterium]